MCRSENDCLLAYNTKRVMRLIRVNNFVVFLSRGLVIILLLNEVNIKIKYGLTSNKHRRDLFGKGTEKSGKKNSSMPKVQNRVVAKGSSWSFNKGAIAPYC